MPDPPTALAT